MELNDKIAQLELRAGQCAIHLRHQRAGPDATAARAGLLQMLHRLRYYEERRDCLLDQSGAPEIAA